MRTEGGGIPSREKHHPGQVQEQGHKPQGDKENYLKLLASLGKLFIRTIFPFKKVKICISRQEREKKKRFGFISTWSPSLRIWWPAVSFCPGWSPGWRGNWWKLFYKWRWGQVMDCLAWSRTQQQRGPKADSKWQCRKTFFVSEAAGIQSRCSSCLEIYLFLKWDFRTNILKYWQALLVNQTPGWKST